MNKKLTLEQKHHIEELVKLDFECGLPKDDWDETYQMCMEDPDLYNVPKKATDYYFDLVEYGPAGFYEAFCDDFDDWDPDFIAEYGNEAESEEEM